jgi:hypothetical protein
MSFGSGTRSLRQRLAKMASTCGLGTQKRKIQKELTDVAISRRLNNLGWRPGRGHKAIFEDQSGVQKIDRVAFAGGRCRKSNNNELITLVCQTDFRLASR